jgi:hypothetical protein
MSRNSGQDRFRSGLPPKLYNTRGQELSLCVRVFIASLLRDDDSQSRGPDTTKQAEHRLPKQQPPTNHAPAKPDPYFTRVKL